MDQQFDTFTQPRPDGGRPTLGLVGIGAFGGFCIPHLRCHFELRIADGRPDLGALADGFGVTACDLEAAASSDIVVLAVPLGALRRVARAIAPVLRRGALVVDVCSIKCAPATILRDELPSSVDIVGTHPLFGPQSGRHGIEGQRIAVCPVRGRRSGAVARFLRCRLGLDVLRTSAEIHDREMAHVQGLTHLVARVLKAMDLPRLGLKTTSFSHLGSLVGLVGEDSDELFRTILLDNPFARQMTRSFVSASARVLDHLAAEPRPATPANGVATIEPVTCGISSA